MKKFNDTYILVKLGNVYGDYDGYSYAGMVWDKNGLAPSLTTCQGGGREPMIIVEDNLNE